MTSNQLHGKKFEDFVKACGLFPGASDSARSVNAGFDIEARFDRELGLPTSIKASGSDNVALSDARRFFALDVDFRMIVGRYRQVDRQKVFSQIHEFILTRDALESLRGELSLAHVEAIHNGILLDQFSKGSHVQAREWAALRKRELEGLTTRIILNQKIDSKSQRRLQCSVSLHDLRAVCADEGHHKVHQDSIGDLVLPVIQNSARRTFSGS